MSFLANAKKLVETAELSNYIQNGRHLVRIISVSFRDTSIVQGKTLAPIFNCDVEVLSSPIHAKGETLRANVTFKDYADKAMARMCSYLAVAKSVKIGKVCSPKDLGIENVTDSSFEAELSRLLGPEQPLAGAVIVVEGIGGTNRTTGKPYTITHAKLPGDADLAALV